MMGEITRSHRLYLAKGDGAEEIYVDTVILPQHQYDGIRYLYRQYKKGKPGVILNDPSGYGKRTQTVLFLNAMHPVMSLPSLILCPEGAEDVWVQQFQQWTSMFIGSDVLVQQGYQYSDCICLIGTISQLHLLSKRDWGILIIDDNAVSRDVLRSELRAKYKIWITSFDMKKFLPLFSSIYKWLYPRDKLVLEDYQSERNPTILLAKSARLDALMQEVVIRRRDAVLPLGKVRKSPEPPQVSRKNKDSTGKKIKRSKPRPDVTTADSQETSSEQNTPLDITNNGLITEKKEIIEHFIVNIQSEIDKNKEDPFATSSHTNDTNFMIISEDVIALGSDDTHIDPNLKDNAVLRHSPKPDTQHDSYNIFNSNIINSQNIVIKYDSETQDIEPVIPMKKSKITNQIYSESLQFESDDESEIANNHDTNFITTKTNQVKLGNRSNLFSEDLPKSEVDEIRTDDCKDEVANKSNVSENNKTDPQLSGIDLKIKEMEELAMKKFQGSFLDRMLN